MSHEHPTIPAHLWVHRHLRDVHGEAVGPERPNELVALHLDLHAAADHDADHERLRGLDHQRDAEYGPALASHLSNHHDHRYHGGTGVGTLIAAHQTAHGMTPEDHEVVPEGQRHPHRYEPHFTFPEGYAGLWGHLRDVHGEDPIELEARTGPQQDARHLALHLKERAPAPRGAAGFTALAAARLHTLFEHPGPITVVLHDNAPPDVAEDLARELHRLVEASPEAAAAIDMTIVAERLAAWRRARGLQP